MAESIRHLKPEERIILEKNGCSSSDWSKITISGKFKPEAIRQTRFFGEVWLKGLDGSPLYRDKPWITSGIENSVIVDSVIDHGSSIRNVDLLVNTIIGKGCYLSRIHELSSTGFLPLFKIKIKNENGKRICPIFPGFFEQLTPFLENNDLKIRTESIRHNCIADGSVLENCGIIRDLWCSERTTITDARFIEKIVLQQDAGIPAHIFGVDEISHGIIQGGSFLGCGVKARWFYCGQNSKLLDDAQLEHVILGANSTISGAEIRHAVIYPFHEQHHASSFLIAAETGGQSNIAAGAVLGSNHNSRRNDGELKAGRGFWPGLCVSLKLSSFFSSFNMLVKGDYPRQIFNPLPFSLVSRAEDSGQLIVYPGYWLIYNLYALERNYSKYLLRDKRADKKIKLECHYLEPDTVSELLEGIHFLESIKSLGMDVSVEVNGLEEGNRKVILRKPQQAVQIYRDMILYYVLKTLSSEDKRRNSGNNKPAKWINIAGVSASEEAVSVFRAELLQDREIDPLLLEQKYQTFHNNTEQDKGQFASDVFALLYGVNFEDISDDLRKELLTSLKRIMSEMSTRLHNNRQKDYDDPIRLKIYSSEEEQKSIIGDISDDELVLETQKRLARERQEMEKLLKKQ